MIPGTTSIRLDINTGSSASGLSASTGVIEAVIGRVPLGANQEAGITLRMEGPLGSEPELEVREKIGGQDVGGRTYRPPTPFQVYLPVILKRLRSFGLSVRLSAHAEALRTKPVEDRSGARRQREKPRDVQAQ